MTHFFKFSSIPALVKIIVPCYAVLCIGCRSKPTQPDKTPISLRVEAPTDSIYSGGELQLSAFAIYRDNATSNVTPDAVWSNSPGIAGNVNESGLFNAATNVTGAEMISAAYRGQKDSIAIAVTKRATTLAISPVYATVASANKIQFEAIAGFQDESKRYVTSEVDWALTPGTSAEIEKSGLLTANAGTTGEETVTASFQGLVAHSTISVVAEQSSLFEMVTIPAGSFIMGDDDGRPDEQPAHRIYLDSFEIGKYEITNAQYVNYLNQAIKCGEIFIDKGVIRGTKGAFANLIYGRISGSDEFPQVFIEADEDGVTTECHVISGYEYVPVVRLNWCGAQAFCSFYGFRLPTEAEWEMASRGGRQFEFGTQDGMLTHDLANYQGVGDDDIYVGLAPVGTFPANPYGIYDLCGNAAEFVFDLYDPDYYSYGPVENPTGPGPAKPLGSRQGAIIWRGGSWFTQADQCRSAYRGHGLQFSEHIFISESMIGFRVARSLPQ